MGYKKARVPKAYIQTQITQGIRKALEKHRTAAFKQGYTDGYEDGSNDVKGVCTIQFSEKIDALRKDKQNLESHVDALNADLSEAERQLEQKDAHYTSQIHRLNAENVELKQKLEAYSNQPIPFVNNSTFIHNWRDSWKWLSNQFFVLIAFIAVTPIPDEVLAVLPENIRVYVIAFTAFCGLVGRNLNQSKGVQQWLSKS